MSRLGVLLSPMPRARAEERHLESKPALVARVVGRGSRIARMWMFKKAMPPARAEGIRLWSMRPTACPS
jgi:hypothetical protein